MITPSTQKISWYLVPPLGPSRGAPAPGAAALYSPGLPRTYYTLPTPLFPFIAKTAQSLAFEPMPAPVSPAMSRRAWSRARRYPRDRFDVRWLLSSTLILGARYAEPPRDARPLPLLLRQHSTQLCGAAAGSSGAAYGPRCARVVTRPISSIPPLRAAAARLCTPARPPYHEDPLMPPCVPTVVSPTHPSTGPTCSRCSG